MKGLLLVPVLGLLIAASPIEGVSVKATPGTATKGVIPVTVSFSIPSGYHIYGANPGSTGIATSVKVKGSDFKISKVSYPKPKIITILGEKMEVYEKRADLMVQLKPTKKMTGKKVVKLSVTSQACNDRTCLPPETSEVSLTVNVK